MLQYIFLVKSLDLIFDRYLRTPDKLLLKFWNRHREINMGGTLLSFEQCIFVSQIHAEQIEKLVCLEWNSTMQVILQDRKL